MKRLQLSFIDRLADRGYLDKYGFIAFAFGGAAIIVIAKALAVPAVLVTILASSALIVYAVIVHFSGTGRLRSDQAGDNCYYLGLIYTLASLAYAIFTFDPANTATTIIQGFGIALMTTIIGLVLRVYFNQSRPDIAESETSARLELAEASSKLKAELSRSIVSMNDFSRQTRQSLEELRDEILASLKTTSEAAEHAIAQTAQQATSAATEQADAFIGRSRKLNTATDRVVGGMEKQVSKLSELDESQTAIAASLAALEAAASSSQTILNGLSAQSDDIRQLHAETASAARELSASTHAFRDYVASLTSSAERLESVLTEKISEIQVVPRQVADAAISEVGTAIERVRDELQSMVDAQARVTAELAEQVRAGADAAGRHNSALEAELAKSRENVAKVHGALVDMTKQIAERVEATA